MQDILFSKIRLLLDYTFYFLQLNLSALGRKYNITGPRGNMVVREFLENNNIDLAKFKNPFINNNKIRRSTVKMPG